MSEHLATLQRHVQNSILRDDARSVADMLGGPDGTMRLGIYACAYRLRLREALAHNFQRLSVQLADEFDALADGYLEAHPSTNVSVRAIGHRFAEWLEERRPNEPWLAELARFEWALAAAFDALDAQPTSGAELTSVAADDWPALRFGFAPAVQRLQLTTNAVDLYQQVAPSESPATGGRCTGISEWLVWRHDLAIRYRSLEGSETLALDTLRSGGSFAEMCDRLAGCDDEHSVPARAAAFLKRWIVDGLIVAIDASGPD